jgi:hypothetical protein
MGETIHEGSIGSFRSRDFRQFAISAIVVKLWLTSFIAINVHLAPHDNGNFLEHAKFISSGDWFGPYNDLTLIKGPGIELYLAFIREFGLPLPLGHQLGYLAGCILVSSAIAPLVRNGRTLGLIFCAIFFDPFTFSSNAWILNRSQLTDTLALFFVAGAMGAILRATSPIRYVVCWLGLFGAAAAAFFLTREDTVWILLPSVAFLGAYLAALQGANLNRPRLRSALVIIPMLLVLLSNDAIATLNGIVYGWRTTVETTSPEFVSAYQSLARIVVPGVADNRTFPAPRAVRAMAARVSPAAAAIEPFFDPNGMWERTSCGLKLCGDVSSGWFVWAFRDAVQGAGYYKSGSTARRFYIEMSREIDAACNDGRIVCREKGYSLAPPLHVSDVPSVLVYAAETLWHSASFDQVTLGGPERMTAADESVRADYASVIGSAGSHIASFRGWLVRPRGSSIRLAGRLATDFLSIDFEPSPDVAKRFEHDGALANDDVRRSRFVISTSCVTDCVLLVTNGAHVTHVPLAPSATDFLADDVVYHLDFSSNEPVVAATGGVKSALLAVVLALYKTVVPIATIAAFAALAFRMIRVARGKRSERSARLLLLSAGIAAAIVAQCGVLGVVSAVSFYALYPEYEAALYPLVLLGTALEIAVEAPILFRMLRRLRTLNEREPVIATRFLSSKTQSSNNQ